MKKVLAVVMAVMLMVGVAPMALAATITYSYDDIGLGYSSDNSAGYLAGEIDLDENLSPSNNTIQYPLFVMGDVDTSSRAWHVEGDTWVVQMTRKMVKDGKIEPKLRVASGQRVVDKAELVYTSQKDASGATLSKDQDLVSLKITFKDKFVSTGSADYKFTVYLTQDKKRLKNTEVTFTGKFKNQETTVDSGDTYIYLGDDVPVVESLAYLKDIDIELDDGLTVHTKFFNNKKYYANGEAKVRSDDDAVITKYPDIDQVFNIDQVGLNNSYTTVSISGIGKNEFVYNADLEFVGTGDQKLPFSTKYYVSSKELDVETGDIEEPVEEPGNGDTFEPDPGLGGDDVPENVNDNPGTGR